MKKEFVIKMKNSIKENWMFVLEVLLCFLLVLVHTLLVEGHTVDFSPMNGTFQNYNPIRRFLDGQIPYRDFTDYLGLGHLYIGSLATLIFGGTYRSSLLAFSFVTFASFAVLSYVIGKVVLQKKESALAVTNLIMLFLLIKPFGASDVSVGLEELKDTLSYSISYALSFALDVGNSTRLIRGLVLPLSCGLLYLAKKVADRIKVNAPWKYAIAVGFVAGMCFVWSNDYGISCFLCILVMTFWYSLCRGRKLLEALKYTGIELLSSLVGLFVTVEIFTLGNFGKWVNATFGTGGYQSWYYISTEKSYYLWDIEMSFPVMLQVSLCIYYLLMMFFRDYKKHQEDMFLKDAVLAYANMAGFCATEEYKLISGGDSQEVAMIVLFLTILFELISIVTRNVNKTSMKHAVVSFSLVVGCAWLLSATKDVLLYDTVNSRDGQVYVEEMDGYLTELGADLIEADAFLGEEKVFATYASAQELVSGTYHPSGTDYIIHVLGDAQRDAYLESFHEGDFTYAATIKETYNEWEFWTQRANWFFYRDLFENWHPVYGNTYEMYWERNASDEENKIQSGFQISVTDIDDATKVISVQCDSPVDGIADVYIDYAVKSRGNVRSLFNILKMLEVSNTGALYTQWATYCETNHLRAVSGEYIPIPVSNGYGEIRITAKPQECAYLELYEYSCDTIYTVTSDYVEVIGNIPTDTGCILMVADTKRNKDVVGGVTGITYGDMQYNVLEINQYDTYIGIHIDSNVVIGQENFIELVR